MRVHPANQRSKRLDVTDRTARFPGLGTRMSYTITLPPGASTRRNSCSIRPTTRSSSTELNTVNRTTTSKEPDRNGNEAPDASHTD